MIYSELYAIIAPCQACSQQSMTWEYAFKTSSTCFDNSGINMTSNKFVTGKFLIRGEYDYETDWVLSLPKNSVLM